MYYVCKYHCIDSRIQCTVWAFIDKSGRYSYVGMLGFPSYMRQFGMVQVSMQKIYVHIHTFWVFKMIQQFYAFGPPEVMKKVPLINHKFNETFSWLKDILGIIDKYIMGNKCLQRGQMSSDTYLVIVIYISEFMLPWW